MQSCWRYACAAVLAVCMPVFAAGAEESTTVPEEFQGSWGANCGKPEMRWDATVVWDLSNKLRGPLTKFVRRADEIEVHYSLKVQDKFLGAVDTLKIEGQTLRLITTQYTGMQKVTWKKHPWQKCGAQNAALPAPPAVQVSPPAAAGGGALGLDSISFPGEQPAASSEPYLADLAKMVSKVGAMPCMSHRAWLWNAAGWDSGRLNGTMQGVIDQFRAAQNPLRKISNLPDNMFSVRVDPTQAGRGAPLILTFYLQEKKDLFLVACITQ